MEFLKQYDVLYKKAKVDFNTAKVVLESFENGNIELDLEVVYFHLQQCTEKLFKSLLSFYKQHFTKTHDLLTLFNAIKQQNIKIDNIDIEFLLPLSEYAVEGRYSIIHDDLNDTDMYIKILEDLLTFVKLEIAKKGNHNAKR